MKKYRIGIQLKSGAGYSTEITAYDEADATFRCISKAKTAGFKTNGLETKILYIYEK